jgi:parvulin-like peptidyl-prolyl isomerase
MRKATKSVLWFVVIAFVMTILFSWGMNVTSKRKTPKHFLYAGMVNGTPISRERLERAIQNLFVQYQQRTGKTPDEKTIIQLQQQAWQTLVEETLMQEAIENASITVTEDEIYNYIKNNPPELIRNQEAFQTEGSFDMDKYHAALKSPDQNIQFWTFLEEYVRSSLPMEKLQTQITAGARITDQELRMEFLNRNEKVKLEYMILSPYNIDREDISATEEEARTYWESHPDEFLREKQAVVEYVEFSLMPGEEDIEDTRERLAELRERIMEGDDFAEIARRFSEDETSKEKGGDLGWVPEHHLTPSLEEAATALKVGEISQPVKDRLGWHLVKLEEKQVEKGKTKYRLSRILLENVPSIETREDAWEMASAFTGRLETMSFEESAAADSLELQESMPFTDPVEMGLEDPFQIRERSFIPGIGLLPDGVRFAFDSQPGDVSEPLNNENGIYILRTKDIVPEHTIPFEEAKRKALRMAELEKQKEKSKEYAERAEQMISEGQSLEKIASAMDFELRTTELVSRRDYIPGIGRDPAFLAPAFTGEIGSVNGPVFLESKSIHAFFHILEKEQPSEDDFQAVRDDLREEMTAKRRQDLFNFWFTSLKKNAVIEDMRFAEYKSSKTGQTSRKRPTSPLPF